MSNQSASAKLSNAASGGSPSSTREQASPDVGSNGKSREVQHPQEATRSRTQSGYVSCSLDALEGGEGIIAQGNWETVNKVSK